mmetsp:Transcript_93933/g.303932  ORF Transcript_93933/g.303932 Transcript_93933/m.303932 type:complete len:85 (+) Transcript_93933:229-483(+)
MEREKSYVVMKERLQNEMVEVVKYKIEAEDIASRSLNRMRESSDDRRRKGLAESEEENFDDIKEELNEAQHGQEHESDGYHGAS